MTRRAAIGPILVAALTAACTCGRRSDGACDDPSLWYAPDGAGGVYWGCAPPAGWTSSPPRGTADTAALAAGPADLNEPRVLIPDAPAADTDALGTLATATTGATASTGDTAQVDTGNVPGPADTTMPLETGAIDTAAAADTVPADTAMAPADTAAPPAAEEPPP